MLFEWQSLDFIPVTDTYAAFSGGTQKAPFDYFHINSIAIAPDGDLVISSRNTCTVYKVARPSGQVQWRLGAGKRSSFQMGPGATFWVAAPRPPAGRRQTLSLFDDGASPQKETQSRAILLDVDTAAMRATLTRSYTHPAKLLAANQGSMQLLPDGRVLVGWGNLPYFTEFAQDGMLLLDGQFPVGDRSYRVHRELDRFLARHRVDPGKAAIFEDLARNLEVPHALGMTTVLVVPAGTREVFREEWELAGRDAPHVDHVTDDLAGFLCGIAVNRGGG